MRPALAGPQQLYRGSVPNWTTSGLRGHATHPSALDHDPLPQGKRAGVVDKDVTVVDIDKRLDKEKIIAELEQLTGS